MRNYELAYEFIDNDTILVGSRDDMRMARMSGSLETRAYRIAYAEPDAVRQLLPNLTRITESNLVTDSRLRTIYATGTPDVLEEIAIAVQRLDNPGRQIMLHARILQFNQGDELQVATTLNAIYDQWQFNYASQSGARIQFDRREPRGRGVAVRTFDAELQALETRTSTRVLANSSVITIDNMEAEVRLTDEHVYQSGRDDAGNPEFDSLEVGPLLRMTPRIGRDNVITLTLDLSTSEILESRESVEESVIASSRRQVQTNVRVRDGEPFVVGGLFRENNRNDRYRIPILGNLPLLGEIFTYRSRSSTTTQVVMVVIPYILDTPDVGVEQERLLMRR